MTPLLTTGTVTMTRNAGDHWLITIALAAVTTTVSQGPASLNPNQPPITLELPAGNEITLRVPLGNPVPPQGSIVAFRLADTQIDEGSLTNAAIDLEAQLATLTAQRDEAEKALNDANDIRAGDALAKAELERQLDAAQSDLADCKGALVSAQHETIDAVNELAATKAEIEKLRTAALAAEEQAKAAPPAQPPADNAHVAPGAEQFAETPPSDPIPSAASPAN